MHYAVSHHKLKLILSGAGLKSGDAAGIDKLFGGKDGYYWFGTLRDMCPEGKTLTWDQALQSKEDLTPESYDLGPAKKHPVAIPGITRFV